MLESLPFEGTIKVRNKGIDLTILADAATVERAYAVSRILVVCGISTAVLEITCFDPLDTETLGYYARTTPALLAMTEQILDVVRPELPPDTRLLLFDGGDQTALLAAARQAARHE